MKYQSGLGDVVSQGRKDLSLYGHMSIGRVVYVHDKKNTADVVLTTTSDTIMSTKENEGKFSCLIAVNTAHWDNEIKKSYGERHPLKVGTMVIVSFLDGKKGQPVILGCVHNTLQKEGYTNILTNEYPLPHSDIKEKNKYLKVYPMQDYHKVDGEGNMEFALHHKTFLRVEEGELDDDHLGTDFKDLTEIDSLTGYPLTMEDPRYQSPKNILFVVRDHWNDEATTWTKMFFDTMGLFRFTRDNRDNTLTFLEVDEDGQFRLKRQVDSSYRDQSENHTEVSVGLIGDFTVERTKGGETTLFTVDRNGEVKIDVKGKCSLTINEDGKIDIHSQEDINLSSDKEVTVQGSQINLN